MYVYVVGVPFHPAYCYFENYWTLKIVTINNWIIKLNSIFFDFIFYLLGIELDSYTAI